MQINRTINSAYDLMDEIKEADIIAVAAPIDMQAQFVKIAKEQNKPVITALSERVFKFMGWEQLDEIEIQKEDFTRKIETDKKVPEVLWISRHEMSEEQLQALGECNIVQIDRTLKSAEEIRTELESADIVAVVIHNYPHHSHSII